MFEKYLGCYKGILVFPKDGNSGLDQSFSCLNVSHWGSCYRQTWGGVWVLHYWWALRGCQCYWLEDHTVDSRTHKRRSMPQQSTPDLWRSGLCLPLQPQTSPSDPATLGHQGLVLAFALSQSPSLCLASPFPTTYALLWPPHTAQPPGKQSWVWDQRSSPLWSLPEICFPSLPEQIISSFVPQLSSICHNTWWHLIVYMSPKQTAIAYQSLRAFNTRPLGSMSFHLLHKRSLWDSS